MNNSLILHFNNYDVQVCAVSFAFNRVFMGFYSDFRKADYSGCTGIGILPYVICCDFSLYIHPGGEKTIDEGKSETLFTAYRNRGAYGWTLAVLLLFY